MDATSENRLLPVRLIDTYWKPPIYRTKIDDPEYHRLRHLIYRLLKRVKFKRQFRQCIFCETEFLAQKKHALICGSVKCKNQLPSTKRAQLKWMNSHKPNRALVKNKPNKSAFQVKIKNLLPHIIPIDSFDLTIEAEQFRCFHWSNLQPLWGAENKSKSNKMPPKLTLSH